MASLNKVTLIGHLGRDPETRYMPNGDAVCNFSIATTRSWKDKNSGDKQEETEWHRITAYQRLAEVCGEYLKKGSPVYIEGRLKTRKWQDKEGKDCYTTEVIMESMQMLGTKGDGGGQRSGPPAEGQRERPAAAPGAKQSKPSSTGFDDMDDDIPF